MDSTLKSAVHWNEPMKPSSVCPDVRTLESLLCGRLPFPQLERLARHLETCPDCSRRAENLGIDDPLVSTLTRSDSLTRDPEETRINRLIHDLSRRKPGGTIHDGAKESLSSLRELNHVSPRRSAALPEWIGPYRIQMRLGAGGMGEVYLARQDRPNRAVALKVFQARSMKEGDRLLRFEAEAEVTARLRHPHIVQVYEAGEEGDIAYIAMELVEGESLAARLARAVLAPNDSAVLLGQLAGAVQFAHASGVIHRDLKPSNVLLDRDGTPKLSDFGLAKVLDGDGNQTQTGELLGTPAYMAPEQTTNGKAVGPATDIYGLGAILYECLTGRPPFKGSTSLETLQRIQTQDPIPPGRLQPGIPRDLQTICLKCLDKDPNRRYASAADFAADLERYLSGKPIAARPVGLLRRAAKWARRKPTIAGLLLVIGLLAAGLAGLILTYTVRLRQEVNRANESAAEAHRQEERAAANYRSARQTLNQMLQRHEDYRGSQIPRMIELQKSQLEDALAFYKNVLESRDDPDPEVQFDTALTACRIGEILIIFAKESEAKAICMRALEMFAVLPNQIRERPDCRNSVIYCYVLLSYLQKERSAREDLLTKALAEAEALSRSDPANPQWQNSLAKTEHNLGVFFWTFAEFEPSEKHYRRSIEIRTQLISAHPDVEKFQAEAAESLINIGLVYASLNKTAQASDAYRRADDYLRPLVLKHPGDDGYGLSLAAVNCNWVNILMASDLPVALAKSNEAVTLSDAAFQREPQSIYTRSRVLNSHGLRAQTLEKLGRLNEALVDWDRVVEMADESTSPEYRVSRAVLMLKAGQRNRAVAEAYSLAANTYLNDDQRYNLACILALSADAAKNATGLGAFVDFAAAEAHAGAAIALLRKLQLSGFFKRTGNTRYLAEDADLEILRSRSDFRALIAAETAKP